MAFSFRVGKITQGKPWCLFSVVLEGWKNLEGIRMDSKGFGFQKRLRAGRETSVISVSSVREFPIFAFF
jgi:hypothetical protein